MNLDKYFDQLKTSLVAIISVLGIEGLNLTNLELIQRMIIQGAIGLLTVIYLIKKIKQHGKRD